MHRLAPVIVLVLLSLIHVISVNKLTRERSELHRAEHQDQLYVMPSAVLKIAALDYDGVLSDFLFIKSMVYLGGFLEPQDGIVRFQLTESQWRGVYNLLDASSAMDPRFQDPYYIANAFLTWDAGLVRETNTLLERGSKARDWDWTMPYFIGFNEFFFLQDNEGAAAHLMEASRRPGASPILAGIAARLAFKERKTENAILFLEDIISRTDDAGLKKIYEFRLEAMKNILSLEKAAQAYRRRFGVYPLSLEHLIEKGFIRELPRDPYGGTYTVTKDGKIESSSRTELEPYVSPFRKSSK